MQSWDLVRVFLALYRAGSYEGASQNLGMDISTVRRKIQALETSLGITVFFRDANGVALGPDHQKLLDAALEMEQAAGRFHRNSADVSVGGIVRVSVLDIFAGLLAPFVKRFHERNPSIVLDITTEPYFVDLEKEEIDIALRLARPMKGAGGMRKLADVRFRRFAATGYAASVEAQPGASVEMLTLSSDFWHRDHEFKFVDERRAHRSNVSSHAIARVDSYPVLMQLCEQGLGVALLPCFLASQNPDLVVYDDDEITGELWLLAKRELARAHRIRETINFLVHTFSALGPELGASPVVQNSATSAAQDLQG